MANNIKIIGNITNISATNRYSEADINLLTSKRLQEDFGAEEDYIEYYVYDAAENLLNITYSYLSYKLPTGSALTPGINTPPNTTGEIQTTDIGIESTLTTTGSLYPVIEIDPIQDLQNLGYSSGEFVVKYNFFQNKISSNVDRTLFVKEISKDRTEIRLGSTVLTNEEIETAALDLINKINNTDSYYVDYLLNFGNNEQYIAVNVALNKDPEGYEVLFKLYKSLPLSVQEKQTLWVVEEQSTPYTFDINLDKVIAPPLPPTLRGPNFDIEIEGQGTVSTAYNNYSNLISSLQSLQNSSYNQVQSLLATQSIDINVDYSNFNNFVFFGSAYQRVYNFYNKVKQIEDYQVFINQYTPYVSTTSSLQSTINSKSASINEIIKNFDGFEYYLYFNSGSTLVSSLDYSITPYPKSGSLLPYTLYSTSSISASVWYNYATGSALNYDANNYDNLEFAVPSFVKDDENNQPFLLFLNMVGHYFDNIWIYLKAVTDINLANNNLDYGISRDIVYQQLKSLGIKLYNSQAGQSVDNYLIGANTGSAVWDNNFTITGSYLNNIPRKDLVAELYKRIYHNLPLLVKTKGTVAGLDNLMTVFGIPNRTYYTVGSESFYTPTGSSATSSILNVKEFGGSLKSELINGYNNDKVRIISNNIVSGSVLSPLLSLQEYPTSSVAFRDDDLHYVDISFSPQTQIDTYISGAIASNNPTWSLDDYIGDPRQQYSGSYSDLDTQRKLYFETGVSGFNPFTASLLDYNGFIRLIEFFDNSLFKMLNDFVPERTSLSTGVTFNSPVLERNKVSYSKPTATTQSVYEANYDVADISSQYGTFYNALSSSNNTKAWYDGNISGSVVDVNQYFEDNYNPYLQPTSSLTPTDINFFNHSDWNVLLNNVSKSVDSNYRKKIEYIYGTTGSITSSAELQDSYLSLRSYNTSRYEGSKTYSLLYNTYTGPNSSSLNPMDFNFIEYDNPSLPESSRPLFILALIEPHTYTNVSIMGLDSINVMLGGYGIINPINYTYDSKRGKIVFVNGLFTSGVPAFIQINSYEGDKSYGKTAAIDINSTKVGWVKSIPSQSLNFYDKTTVNLKYLVDADSNLVELNKRNNNLFDVQNIFKSGDPVIVSISDLEKPSYQKTLDGQKRIFRGGFSYDPIIFRENNEDLTFRHDTPISQSEDYFGFRAYFDDTYTYQAETNDTLKNNSPNDPSSEFNQIGPQYYYLLKNVVNGQGEIIGNSKQMAYENTAAGSWRYTTIGGFPAGICADNNSWGTFKNSINPGRINPRVFSFNLINFNRTTTIGTELAAYIRETDINTYSESNIVNTLGNELYYYRTPRNSTYRLKGRVQFQFAGNDRDSPGEVLFRPVCIVEKSKTPSVENSWEYVANTRLERLQGGVSAFDSNSNMVKFDSNAQAIFSCVLDATETIEDGYYIRFQFYLVTYTDIFGVSGGDNIGCNQFDFSIGSGININSTFEKAVGSTFFEIEDTDTANTTYYYTSTYGQLPPLFDVSGSSNYTIIFSDSSSYLFTTSSVFFEGNTETRKNYTPVIDPFSIQKYDLLRLGKFEELTAKYYEVVDVREDISNPSKPRKVAVLNAPITGSLISQNFAILRPKPDETSVILNFRKRQGDVSPSILVPFDLNDEVKNNIGNIFKDLNPNLQ
jgi:hypothetical protein